jgi:hypothetical protein
MAEADVDQPKVTNDRATAVVRVVGPIQPRDGPPRRVTDASIRITQWIENLLVCLEECLGIWTLSWDDDSGFDTSSTISGGRRGWTRWKAKQVG